MWVELGHSVTGESAFSSPLSSLLIKYVIAFFMCSIVFSQDPYSLEDVNPNSITYGQNVGSSFFSGKVVLHYFGAFT